MLVKCVVFDVDGTLVTVGERVLLPSTIQSIKALQDQGIKVAIASGRPLYAMEQSIMEQIQFDYLICSNGSYVYDVKNDKVIYQYFMSDSLIMQYALACELTKAGALFQFEDAGYVYAGYDIMSTMLEENLGRIDHVINHTEQTRHIKSRPYAIVSYVSETDIVQFREHFKMFNFLAFRPDYYDVNPKNVTKATGINHIVEDLGISKQEVMAFGDAMNDYEMIEYAGIGVAMGNALEEIKNIADYVTTDTDHDGIYRALVHFKLIKEEN